MQYNWLIVLLVSAHYQITCIVNDVSNSLNTINCFVQEHGTRSFNVDLLTVKLFGR